MRGSISATVIEFLVAENVRPVDIHCRCSLEVMETKLFMQVRFTVGYNGCKTVKLERPLFPIEIVVGISNGFWWGSKAKSWWFVPSESLMSIGRVLYVSSLILDRILISSSGLTAVPHHKWEQSNHWGPLWIYPTVWIQHCVIFLFSSRGSKNTT